MVVEQRVGEEKSNEASIRSLLCRKWSVGEWMGGDRRNGGED